MSIESPITEDDNWFIGEDKLFEYYITTSPRVRASKTALKDATAISVAPLPEALANGDKVRFAPAGEAGVVATISAAASAGATSLAVNALSGTVHSGTHGGKVLDITGWALEWVLRSSPGGTTALITKTTAAGGGISITDGASGVCRVTIADTDTLNAAGDPPVELNPGRYYKTLRRTDDGTEVVLSFGEAVLRQPATR